MEVQLLRISEAARIAGIGKSFAYQYVACGEWPSVKLGKAIRVPVSGLQKWIAEREAEAEANAARKRAEAL